MAGFDKIQNGLLFGALFGVLALYASLNIASISFVSNWLNSLVTWLTTQTWSPTWLNFQYLNYVIAAVIGGIVGAYIDSR